MRNTIIENAKSHLKAGGVFVILDFAEFDMVKMPAFHRWIFKKVECPYSFDFIEKDWKKILGEHDLETVSENHYFSRYVRLIKVKKSH